VVLATGQWCSLPAAGAKTPDRSDRVPAVAEPREPDAAERAFDRFRSARA